MAAVAAGELDRARAEVQLLLKERPIYIGGIFDLQFSEVYEGPVLRNRVLSYQDLAAALLGAGMLPEAEQVTWKALQEFHIASRTLQILPPWELLFAIKYLQAVQPEPPAFSGAALFEIARIIAAHGADQLRTPSQIYPFQWPVANEVTAPLATEPLATLLRGLKQASEASRPEQLGQALLLLQNAAAATRVPELRRAIDRYYHGLLVQNNRRGEARDRLAKLWQRNPAAMDTWWASGGTSGGVPLLERDPTLAGYLWQDRPATATLPLTTLADSFRADPRAQVLGLEKLTLRQEGFFKPSNKFAINGASALFYQNVAAELPVEFPAPVHTMALAYRAQGALGIYPIMLLRIDDLPLMPLYLDEKEGLRSFECDLPAGPHRAEFIFINDASFDWPARTIAEDRGVHVDRLLLSHIAPPDTTP